MKYLLLLLACITMNGCTHVSTFTPDDRDVVRVINRKGKWRPLRVNLQDSTLVKVTQVKIEDNCIRWLNRTTQAEEVYHLSEIHRVKYRNHGMGLLDGAGIGFFSGLIIGAGAAHISRDEFPGAENEVTYYGGMLGGLAGGGAMGLMGMMSGANIVFELDPNYYKTTDNPEKNCKLDANIQHQN